MEKCPVYDFGTYEATKTHTGLWSIRNSLCQWHTLAGFDLGKTDYLRKAIGKRKQI